MADLPWLSVIVPTYNGERFLRETLTSLSPASDEGLEVVVVDDGSTDAALDILHAFQRRLNLRLFPLPHRGNWVATTNYGLHQASGQYVSFLHQDDLWVAERLHVLKEAARRHSKEVFLVHPVWFVDEQGRKVGEWWCPLPRGVMLPPTVVLLRLLVQNFIPILGTAFPRSLLSVIGDMDEELWYTADWDLWLRIAARIDTLFVPRLLACFRLHGESLTATRSADVRAFRDQHERVLGRHLPLLTADPARKDLTAKAARLSVAMNATFASLLHRRRPPVALLAAAAVRAAPRGWWEFLR